MMGLIEESLRGTFAAQVAATPTVEDAATRAIDAGQRIRHRRHAIAVAAVVAGVMLAAAGVAANVEGRPDGTPVGDRNTSAAPASPPLPVDVLAGNRIVRADGVALALPGLAEPQRLWRVQDGWLVATWDAGASQAAVWFVDEAGTRRLLTAGEHVAVGRGAYNGPRVAWSTGDQTFFASFVGGVLTGTLSTPRTAGLRPVAIVGTGVLLARSDGGYDVWFPAEGDYAFGPVIGRDAYLGESGDRSAYFGVDRDDPTCLAKVSPHQFAHLRGVCGLTLAPEQRAYASPDLKWLAVVGPTHLDVYNLNSVWDQPEPWVTTAFAGTGAAWTPDGMLVVGGSGKIVHLDPEDAYARSDITVPTGPMTPVWPAEELRY